MRRTEATLDEWGKALLEDLLLIAADRIGRAEDQPRSVEFALTFRLAPDPDRGVIEIAVPTVGDSVLVTALQRPF